MNGRPKPMTGKVLKCYDFNMKAIQYIFPNNAKSQEFLKLLSVLFKGVKTVEVPNKNEIHLMSASGLNPRTVFRIDDTVNYIKMNIGDKKYFDLLDRGKSGNPYNVQKQQMADIARKLAGHIKRIDHTAINLPTSLYSEAEWNELINYLSSRANMYNYPTGEPWPFLLPATELENKNNITNFTILRDPKFELVYDEDTVTIHIDMETDLSKDEVEKLFPDNQGVYFDILKNIYKAIYLDFDDKIDIRIDIRFKCEHGDWENGKWLVQEGGRITPQKILLANGSGSGGRI